MFESDHNHAIYMGKNILYRVVSEMSHTVKMYVIV